MEIVRNIICQVYAGQKSKTIIDLVLNIFLPNYEKLNPGYTFPPNNENYIFKTEDEMINYFIKNKALDQTFLWNKYDSNPYKIMIGANITDDDKLIISLTMDTTEEIMQTYFNKLKEILESDIGVISYVNPAEYENGRDFILRYRVNNK
ncbi:hypothetical protein [Chryseobacterium jejuense]|uniref:Uncharacterized protein n=1 Tax=Chryseobacterium jejuense TaxID=445960 RepID=A0A2X2X4B9_CHRJE|nr:hypothetical protein [Chryseobacterium jejuense]SDI21394.1 hypothetical protein SAMN05421542_0448 [Chryseobacterium jejuense]SQB46717.1 Uncharacterised protein [Chryseobacterium jejuense]